MACMSCCHPAGSKTSGKMYDDVDLDGYHSSMVSRRWYNTTVGTTLDTTPNSKKESATPWRWTIHCRTTRTCPVPRHLARCMTPWTWTPRRLLLSNVKLRCSRRSNSKTRMTCTPTPLMPRKT